MDIVPRIHIVSSRKKHNGRIAGSALSIDPNIAIVEHECEFEFSKSFVQYHNSRWQVILTDLNRLAVPHQNSRRYVPIIHFAGDFFATNANGSRFGDSATTPWVAIGEIEKHLLEAVRTAKLFLKLRLGANKFSILNERERAVVLLAAEGIPNKTIAKKLNVSVKTIEHCRRQAYVKLGVKSSAEVASIVTFERFISVFNCSDIQSNSVAVTN